MADKETIRIGKISSIDYQKGAARITYEDRGDSTTALFSFLAWQYWMPKIGDQVLVAHLSNGSAAAVILGPTWHNDHRPVEGYEGLSRKEYCNEPGKAFWRYDANTGELQVVVDKKLTIKVGDSTIIEITGDSVKVTSAKIDLN